MPKKKGKGSQGPGLEADETPLVYDRASVHRTLWGDTDTATHGAHDPPNGKGVTAGDTGQVEDKVHAWNAYLGPGGGLQLDAEFKQSQRQGRSISVSSGDRDPNTLGTRASIFSTVHEVKKGANRKLSSLAMAAMGGNQRGSVQISEPIIQPMVAPSGPFFPDTSLDPVLMTTQQPLVSLRQALESSPVERSTSDAQRRRELNGPSKSPKRQVSLSKTALGYAGIPTHRPSTLHPPVPQLASFMTGLVTIDKTQSRRASPATSIFPATTIAVPILPTVAATMEPPSTSRRQSSTGLRGQRLQSRPGDEDEDGCSPLTSRVAVKEETQRPQAYKVMRFQSLKEMEADLEHQASSDEDEDEVLPAVSVGDVFMPCGNVIFARGVDNLNGREVVRVVRLDRASETIIDQLDRKMAISQLLPETGRYECILRAKTRIPAHPITGHDTEALKLMVQESLSGEAPVAMDEAQARKYFGSGKRQAYFKRYKACGLKSYDKPRQSMTYTQVLRAEAVPFGTTTLSDDAGEPRDKRAPSSAGAAKVETISPKDKMAAPRAQNEARESGVIASRRVSASVGILSQLEEQKMLPWPLLGHLEEMGSPRLNLRHLGIGPVFSEALAKGFRGLGFLETVDVTNNRIDARSAETLLLALRDHQSLWRLVLDFNRIGPRGASGLVCVLRSSTPLRELSLRANDLGDPIASQVLWALVGHASIRHVCMAGNRIGNNGSLMVRRMLEKGNRLTHLDLGWNNVRGEGAKNLAEGINRNRSLTYLDLSWNGLRGEGLTMLATSLGNHPVLSEVRLERAIWALSEVTALFAALRLRQPKLQVHICDGDMDAASKQDAALLIEAKALVFTNSPTPPAPPGCELNPADLGDRDPGLAAGEVAKTPAT